MLASGITCLTNCYQNSQFARGDLITKAGRTRLSAVVPTWRTQLASRIPDRRVRNVALSNLGKHLGVCEPEGGGIAKNGTFLIVLVLHGLL